MLEGNYPVIFGLKSISALDVSRFIRRCNPPFAADQFRVFINDKVLNMNIFADDNIC